MCACDLDTKQFQCIKRTTTTQKIIWNIDVDFPRRWFEGSSLKPLCCWLDVVAFRIFFCLVVRRLYCYAMDNTHASKYTFVTHWSHVYSLSAFHFIIASKSLVLCLSRVCVCVSVSAYQGKQITDCLPLFCTIKHWLNLHLVAISPVCLVSVANIQLLGMCYVGFFPSITRPNGTRNGSYHVVRFNICYGCRICACVACPPKKKNKKHGQPIFSKSCISFACSRWWLCAHQVTLTIGFTWFQCSCLSVSLTATFSFFASVFVGQSLLTLWTLQSTIRLHLAMYLFLISSRDERRKLFDLFHTPANNIDSEAVLCLFDSSLRCNSDSVFSQISRMRGSRRVFFVMGLNVFGTFRHFIDNTREKFIRLPSGFRLSANHIESAQINLHVTQMQITQKTSTPK